MEIMTSADLHADFDIASFREPTIAELLADPLTRALMKADHVDADDLARKFGGRLAKSRYSAHIPAALPQSEARARTAPRAFAMARRSACGSHCTW
jgi:hypothetical protein